MTEMEKVFNQILEKGYKKESTYDYLVLFTGGKDSAYLAHVLKNSIGGRVCLFTVDNGFEEPSFIERAKETAYKLGCDYYIFQSPVENFIRYYRFLIKEPRFLKIDARNPMCFFCGRYFMGVAVEFAERNNIPFVAYGASPEQINEGQAVTSMRGVQIFEMVSRRLFKENYEKVKQMEGYNNDPVLKSMLDKVFYVSKTVRLIFPFQFLDYHIENMKKTLSEEYGWENPMDNVDNKKYLSSGCRMVKLFGILKEKMGFNPRELEQFDKDYAKGILNKEAYEYNRKFYGAFFESKITPEVEKLAAELGLKKELLGE